MAILYGTTADGESLPVQVNEFGQLVAQGVPGAQGETGPPGPPGPVGDVEFTSGTFSPVFASDDPSAEAHISYDQIFGYWYRFGPLLTVQVRLRTSQFVITSPRGLALVSGLPAEAHFAQPNYSSVYGPSTVWELDLARMGGQYEPRCLWDNALKSFRLYCKRSGVNTALPFADLDSAEGGQTLVVMSFSGLADGAARSVDIPLDELM